MKVVIIFGGIGKDQMAGDCLPRCLLRASAKIPDFRVAGTPDTAGSLTTEIATTDFVAVSQNLHQLLLLDLKHCVQGGQRQLFG